MHLGALRRAVGTGPDRRVETKRASDVLAPLIDDAPGVRKVALKSVPVEATANLHHAVEDLADRPEADKATRRLSRETLRRLGG